MAGGNEELFRHTSLGGFQKAHCVVNVKNKPVVHLRPFSILFEGQKTKKHKPCYEDEDLGNPATLRYL